jgi:hypothetical protein
VEAGGTVACRLALVTLLIGGGTGMWVGGVSGRGRRRVAGEVA